MPSEVPGFADLGGGIAHALNNVVGVLYAASSYLEEPLNPKLAGRARKAVDDACANALALSAALSLLSLAPSDAELARRSGARPLERQDLERLGTVLREVAEVQLAAPASAAEAIALHLEREIVQSVLVCAAYGLRRLHGRQAVLQGTLSTTPPAPHAAAELRFEVRTAAAAAAEAAGARAGSDPYLPALRHASAMLQDLGLSVAACGADRVSLAVRAAPIQPRA